MVTAAVEMEEGVSVVDHQAHIQIAINRQFHPKCSGCRLGLFLVPFDMTATRQPNNLKTKQHAGHKSAQPVQIEAAGNGLTLSVF